MVDAGGKAFVYFLEGIIRYTDRGQIRQFPLKEEKATLKYLIRGGRITKAKGLVAKILHVNPILSISSQGKLFSVAKAWGRKHLEKKIIDLATEGGKEQTVRLAAAVAHTNAFQIGQRIKYKLQERTGQNIEMMMNASPVLGAHAGPGAFGVAVLKRALQSSPESGLQKT